MRRKDIRRDWWSEEETRWAYPEVVWEKLVVKPQELNDGNTGQKSGERTIF